MTSKNSFINNYPMIVENMVDGLFTVDNDRTITFWNKAAEDILGYTKEEAIGKKCDFLQSPTCMGARFADKDGTCALFCKGKIARKRCIVTAKDGSSKYLLKNAQVLKDTDGKVIGAVENIVDITEQVEHERELNLLRKKVKGRVSFCKIIGNHYTMQNIYSLLELAKDSTASVIIYGESGTGKELVAHAIHFLSYRRKKPFIKVNCAALAETLLESELFGHVKGSFTDAIRDRKGRFEEAHGGTVFLDEIGDLPLAVQVKLLRVLQEKKIERVGDNNPIDVDVRIISATNQDLQMLIKEGRFREDFFYRLNVIPIRVPPLRERKSDITLLVDHLITMFCRETGKHIVRCDQYALNRLMHYDWPGNVRELENAIEYAFVTCCGDTIHIENLPEQIAGKVSFAPGIKSGMGRLTDDTERIRQALASSGGNKTQAAKQLGYSRVTLWKKMKKAGLS